MRGPTPLVRSVRRTLGLARPATVACRQRRAIQISAAPTTEAPRAGDAFGAAGDAARDTADARFEVLGSPYSLLSVTLSASQKLYTRRGTLVAVAGNAENAQSTLSILSPLTRAFLGVPFLYQRIFSTTPITTLIATKSPTTTFAVLHLDGTTDWMVSQRNALLAWTGHTLILTPRIRSRLSLAHWGSTHITGRGLAALTAPGQIYKLELSAGEEFVAHPASVVAYEVSRKPPLPFRLKSSSLRLQVPQAVYSWFPESTFLKNMRDTDTYKFLSRTVYSIRTALRRTIWGDRLFLKFTGPATLLMSSRGVRLVDSLTAGDLNEIADAPAGVVPKAVELAIRSAEKKGDEVGGGGQRTDSPPAAVRIAAVGKDGKVTFEDAKDLKQFVR